MSGGTQHETDRYITVREPPDGRKTHCEGGIEHHLSEGAVMIAFAIHLLDQGASSVNVHPDGEHLKRYDPKATLIGHGFEHVTRQGSTTYGGVYSRGAQTITIIPKPGLGDVVAQLDGRMLVAECKGGVVNTRHPGQLSKLRRGLCEAVGPNDENAQRGAAGRGCAEYRSDTRDRQTDGYSFVCGWHRHRSRRRRGSCDLHRRLRRLHRHSERV